MKSSSGETESCSCRWGPDADAETVWAEAVPRGYLLTSVCLALGRTSEMTPTSSSSSVFIASHCAVIGARLEAPSPLSLGWGCRGICSLTRCSPSSSGLGVWRCRELEVKSYVVGKGCRWKVCLEVTLLKQGELRLLESI